jgi:uncharacterized membrane protein YhaH (DUF805 family)
VVRSTPEEQSLTNNKYYRATGGTALKAALVNAFNYTGRSTRAEFWWLTLFAVGYFFLTGVVYFSAVILAKTMATALVVVVMSLMARRYQDVGAPGLLGTIQIAATYLLNYVSAPGDNAEMGLRILWDVTMVFDKASWLAMFIIVLLPSRKLPAVADKD